MSNDSGLRWQRFQVQYLTYPALDLAVDFSRSGVTDGDLDRLTPFLERGLEAMAALEGGAIANPDEQRRVGHYWLRTPRLAPDLATRTAIEESVASILRFSEQVHSGRLAGAHGPFRNLLVIGIGGSALGPMLANAALGHPTGSGLRAHFFDNTDPDGMDVVLGRIGPELGQTLCVVISKSGGTKETSNGMKEAMRAYQLAGLSFEKHAVAVTMPDSTLDRLAGQSDGSKAAWLARFPIWDWVGGRTSQTSAVGLLPAALQGFNIRQLLEGAAACDDITRGRDVRRNPGTMLAALWYILGRGQGARDMVVLPYKDRLELLSRYLQQLVMESLGKERDLRGQVVNQGLAVYGNKGSTDQHAYIQQLREGLDNFFVLFVEVLKDRAGDPVEVEPGITSGDYLSGFLLGTREALCEKGRPTLTLTLGEVSARSLGVLIALFERTVGLYAHLIGINAYHQPGVEAGKKAAGAVLQLQKEVVAYLAGHQAGAEGRTATAEQIARDLGKGADPELVFKICQHLAANRGRKVKRLRGDHPSDTVFGGI